MHGALKDKMAKQEIKEYIIVQCNRTRELGHYTLVSNIIVKNISKEST